MARTRMKPITISRRSLLAGAAASIAAYPSVSHSQAPLDTAIIGGRMIDPIIGFDDLRDVGFKNGVVAALGTISPGNAINTIDAQGRLVVSGLVNIHAHIVNGSKLGVDPDIIAREDCSTTIVSAGDVGPSMVKMFRNIVDDATARVFCWVNVSNAGLTPWPVTEFPRGDYINVSDLTAALVANWDICLGVKVRQTAELVGDLGVLPLIRAIEACEAAQQAAGKRFRVMCHIGGLSEPSVITDILGRMRSGDVLTHAYVGYPNHANLSTGLAQNFDCIPAATMAKSKGVLFDTANGFLGFDYLTAEICNAVGHRLDSASPDNYSTTSGIQGGRFKQTTVMSMLMVNSPGYGGRPPLNYPLLEVVRLATSSPAVVLADRVPLLGTLQMGAPGDAAILTLEAGNFEWASYNNAFVTTRTGLWRLSPYRTVLRGLPMT